MLSLETQSLLINLFLSLSESHRNILIRRNIIQNNFDCDSFNIFSSIKKDNCYITSDCLVTYITTLGLYISNSEAIQLISTYDSDKDKMLSYKEFCSMLGGEKRISTEPSLKCTSYSVTLMMKRLLDKEIELIRKTNQIIDNIKMRFDFTLKNVFNTLKGNNDITFTDIKRLFDNNKLNYIDSDIDMIINRLDINNDGKISLCELASFFNESLSSECKCYHCINKDECEHSFIKNNTPSYIERQSSTAKTYCRLSSSRLSLRLSPKRKIKTNSKENTLNSSIKLPQFNSIRAKAQIASQKESEEAFVGYLNSLIQCLYSIEKMKKDLAVRNDFNIEDLYSLFSNMNTENINVSDIKEMILTMKIKTDDINAISRLILNRYDIHHNSVIEYEDLFDMFVPFDKSTRDIVEHREMQNIKSIDDYMINTSRILKALLTLIIESEDKLNTMRKKMSSTRNCLRSIYSSITDNRITIEELKSYCESKNVDVSDRRLELLFIRLDKNRDNYVDYFELEEELLAIY